MKRIVLAIAMCLAALCAQGQWQSLFNGRNLSGWKVVAGTAEYKVVDGTIEGIAKMGSPNTFLRTEKEYGDFILEMLFRVDEDFNSGVQFRSHIKDGRVCGYQYEIDPSARAWSGGVYDEARLGWLYPLTGNPKAQAAFRHGEWNKVRIEAIGNSIRTWINGVPAADMLDAQDSQGFIALQVHSIGDASQAGKKVAWKDIRIMTAGLEYEKSPATCCIPQFNCIPNTISEREAAQGWKLLWDGKTTAGWRSHKAAAFPAKGWNIKDGILSVEKADGAESGNGGDIITIEKYRNFVLSVDFMITPGANSGIKYFVNPDINSADGGSAIGCEFQVLDDKLHPDAKLGVAGNRTLGSLYDLIAAPDNKPFRGGFFNNATIVVQGNHVEHWLNGVKIVEYERNNQMWNALVKYSKYRDWVNFGNFESGHILLQDHGDAVHYKNVKIKELK